MLSSDGRCCHVRRLRRSLGAVTELGFQPPDGASSQSLNPVVGHCCISRTSSPHFLHASFSFIFEGITWEFNSVYSSGMGRCYRWYFSHQAMTRISVLARLQEIPESCCGCSENPGEKTFRLDSLYKDGRNHKS